MEKSDTSSLFANDGSFMDKFKQLQQQTQEKESTSRNSTKTPINSKHAIIMNKKPLDTKVNSAKSSGALNLGGKLAFSLKQKSKLAVPAVNLSAGEDEDEEVTGNSPAEGSLKRRRLGQSDSSVPPPGQGVVEAAAPPSDPAVRKVADKLASFVAKNGRTFEDITRQKNPGDTPFKFLFDSSCSDYKYYENRLIQEENALAQTKDYQVLRTSSNPACLSSSSKKSGGPHKNIPLQNLSYNIPTSALYGTAEETRSPTVTMGGNFGNGESSAPSDPIAMMEYYVKKAAQEERKRLPRHSKDEMPPPDCFEASLKQGHHMGDYIPQEELEKFLSTCNDAAAQKAAREAAEKAKIQADNVGHKLLSKMGWKEGEGLGSSKSGRADPVMAGSVKLNNLGVGAEQPGQVTPEDDIYEQYKKRMMLGYRYRPNPLNNPRKAYY